MSYSSALGRFLERDPIGYSEDGLNLYQAYRSSPINRFDPFGTLSGPGPVAFWDEWSPQKRKEWMNGFHKEYGGLIADSAKKNCVPQELLAAVIANEVIDWGGAERRAEAGFRIGKSVGPAQITAETANREGVWTEVEERAVAGISYRNRGRGSGLTDKDDIKRELLNYSDINIDIAGRLMSKYLKQLCQDSRDGKLSASFKQDVGFGADPVRNYCCPADCDDIVSMDVSPSMIAAMAAIWNNGPKITSVGNIPQQAPNAHIHSQNAAGLDGLLKPDWK